MHGDASRRSIHSGPPSRSATILAGRYFLDRFLIAVATLLVAFLISTAAIVLGSLRSAVEYCNPAGYFRTPSEACIAGLYPTGHPQGGVQDLFATLAYNYLTWAPITATLVACLAVALFSQWYVSSERWRPRATSDAHR